MTLRKRILTFGRRIWGTIITPFTDLYIDPDTLLREAAARFTVLEWDGVTLKGITALSIYIGAAGDIIDQNGDALRICATNVLAMKVPNMDNADIVALTGQNGMIVYDDDNNNFRIYQNGAWQVIRIV